MGTKPDRYQAGHYGPPGVYPRTRMRLSEEGGTLLYSILKSALGAQQALRQMAIEAGEPTKPHNRRIRITRKLLLECERALEEAGWLTSEHRTEETTPLVRTP